MILPLFSKTPARTFTACALAASALFASVLPVGATADELAAAAAVLVRHGIVAEKASAADYRLDRSITRAEMAKVLFGFANEYRSDDIVFGDCTKTVFTDVAKDDGFCKYIVGLSNAGIVTPGGAFRPNDPITRAEAATMIMRAIQARPSSGVSPFRDVSETQVGIHTGYIVRAVELGIIRGYADGTFRPGVSVTRGEAFLMVSRLLK